MQLLMKYKVNRLVRTRQLVLMGPYHKRPLSVSDLKRGSRLQRSRSGNTEVKKNSKNKIGRKADLPKIEMIVQHLIQM